jgi:Rrf2 family protein
MKFSTRTTYGLRAMIRLAENNSKDSISIANIAKDENISPKYLERLFASLKKAELIISEKGSNGGYKLAKSPGDIKIYDIVEVLEGDMNPFHCVGANGEVTCSKKCDCGATSILIKVQKAINSTLQSMSLSDLL